MIRILYSVADFRKKPESSGNTVGYGYLKRECITLFPSLVREGLIGVIHRIIIAGCQ